MVSPIIETGPNILLVADKDPVVVRDRAISTRQLLPGSTILSVDGFATVLLPPEKGRRCDYCHTKTTSLHRCKGCACHYYCDTNCQTMHWKRVHKKMCKSYNRWIASDSFQVLFAHEKMDMILLSHVLAVVDQAGGIEDPRSELVVLTSMMRNPSAAIPNAEPCPSANPTQRELWTPIYQRFGRNNFALHSHLTTYAHGVFPLASRVFNHSCVPNAAPKYIIEKGKMVRMEIVALSEISEGEEICIPYIDPALIQQRVETLGYTYGFLCECQSCKFLTGVADNDMKNGIPPPPSDMKPVLMKLKEFMPCTSTELFEGKRKLPDALKCIFHEEFLERMTTIFSNKSHDGPLGQALVTGEIVLYVYKLVYPENYPQIGMHLLELAKTAWNAIVTSENASGEDARELQILLGAPPVDVFRDYLKAARMNLMVIGEEGDEGGPLADIQTLEDSLASL